VDQGWKGRGNLRIDWLACRRELKERERMVVIKTVKRAKFWGPTKMFKEVVHWKSMSTTNQPKNLQCCALAIANRA